MNEIVLHKCLLVRYVEESCPPTFLDLSRVNDVLKIVVAELRLNNLFNHEVLLHIVYRGGTGPIYTICCTKCRPNLCNQQINYFLFPGHLFFTCSFSISEYTVRCTFKTSSYCVSIHFPHSSIISLPAALSLEFLLYQDPVERISKVPFVSTFRSSLLSLPSKIIIFIHLSVFRHQPLYHLCPKRTILSHLSILGQ